MTDRIVSVGEDFRLPAEVLAALTPADVGAQPAGSYATPTDVATAVTDPRVAAALAGPLSGAAVQTRVDAAVSQLLAGAPGALDTLNELAAALGDDADFAATVSAALATRATLVDGKVPDAQLPPRLSDVELRAASGSSAGPLVDRPAASTTAVRWYFATDDDGGTLYRNTGTSWVQVALGLSEIAQAPMWVPARAFRASVGTPAEGLVASSSQNVFLFDPTTAETAVAMLALPSSWTSINIDLYWTRTGTALDPVVWRVDRKNLAVGAALAGSTVGPNVTSTPDVATATVLFAVRTNTALSVTPPLARLHISRVADDAADTLAVDAAVLGLMISKA